MSKLSGEGWWDIILVDLPESGLQTLRYQDVCENESVSRSVMSDFLWPHGQ